MGIDILHLEDSFLDADLIRARLEKGGLRLRIDRVETRESFIAALEKRRYDVILADFSLPGFDGIAALEIARRLAPECPFILVSATLGEEFAVECLRQGATDYIVKQRMERLEPAIRRAIEESRERAEKRRHRKELSESRDQLSLALEAANLGSWSLEFDTNRFLGCSRFRAIFGLPADGDLSLDGVLESIHPDDREHVRGAIERSGADTGTHDLEFRHLWRDGSAHWVMLRGRVVHDEPGRATRLVGVAQDVTSRKLAEIELRESERHYRVLAESLPQLVWTALPDGHLDYLSGQWCEYTGVAGSEQIGLKAFDAIHPEDRDDSLARWRAAVARGSRYETEHRIRRHDGVYRWFQSRAVPLENAEGTLRWFGTSTDIHEGRMREAERAEAHRKAQEHSKQIQKLADVATRLNAALDVGSVIGVVTEEARLIIGANFARTAVVPDGDWRRGIHRESLADKYANWRGRELKPGDSGLVGLLCRENKSIRLTEEELAARWAEFSEAGPRTDPPPRGWLSAPFVGRNGRNLGLVQLSDREGGEFTEDDEAILVQLANMASVALENARFYDELKEKDRRNDEFLAMLAHELRNPVAAISNGLYLLKITDRDPERLRATEVLNRQLRHLAHLIDDLLDASRITSGKIRLKKDLVDASLIIDQAAASMRPLIEERKHHFETSYPEEGLLIEADTTRIEQVIVNLLTNAAKYTEPGGEVRLTASREDTSIVIEVKDNGIGIPAEKLPQMFELFVQGERSIARSEGGLGIGLTVVQKLTEMHGGEIHAMSDGVGKGSRFVVKLPAADPTSTAVPLGVSGGIASRSVDHEPARKTKVLVVDDNVDTAETLASLLRLLHYEVRTAFDGITALSAAEAFMPEFILLDLGLPGMDGFSVASRIRRDPRFASTLIVAVSGYGQEEDRRRSREAGFDHHLVKPVSNDELLGILSSDPETRVKNSHSRPE